MGGSEGRSVFFFSTSDLSEGIAPVGKDSHIMKEQTDTVQLKLCLCRVISPPLISLFFFSLSFSSWLFFVIVVCHYRQ